jgi:hypothetical protein
MAVVGLIVGVVALVLAAAQVLYARRSAPPRLQLTRDVTVTPLFRGTAGVRDRIEVWYGGVGAKRLTDPKVVQISLQNTGKVAITKDLYDGQPYVIRFGTPAIDLLAEDNNQAEHPAPKGELRGAELHVGPGAIHRGQRLTYAILVDGDVDVQQTSPLPNVRLAEASDLRAPRSTLSVWSATLIAAGLVILVGVTVVPEWLLPPLPPGCPYKNASACGAWHDAQRTPTPRSGTPTPSMTPSG